MKNQPPSAGPAEILIAEDSLTQAMLLQNILEKRGFQVTSTRNGRAALEALKKRRPTMVITDVHMPEMDGYELCRTVKFDPEFATLPVMLLTSLSAPADIIRGLESGADNFVVKPYDEAFLLSRIEAILQNCRLRTEIGGEGIPIYFDGRKYLITSDRRQILNLLLSTYETAVQTNQELIKAHEELKAAQAQLIEAEKLQSVGRLAAGVAHEVRNPLAILEMGILLLSDKIAAEEDKAVLREMQEAVTRANHVITGLMDLSSPHEFGMKDVDIDELIQRALSVMAAGFAERNITVSTELEAGATVCCVDTNKMEQVFLNLLSNALDAMPDGGALSVRSQVRPISIEETAFDAGDRSGARMRQGDRAVSIEILDTGSGIAPENVSKLFEPFFSTKPTGKGMGLGLTVAKKLMDLHGGKIEVRNREGGGVSVRMLLKCKHETGQA